MSNKNLNDDNRSRFYFNVASRCTMVRCHLIVALVTTFYYGACSRQHDNSLGNDREMGGSRFSNGSCVGRLVPLSEASPGSVCSELCLRNLAILGQYRRFMYLRGRL